VDLAAYSAGMTDSFQGTGVWSGIKLEREPKASEATTGGQDGESKPELANDKGATGAKVEPVGKTGPYAE